MSTEEKKSGSGDATPRAGAGPLPLRLAGLQPFGVGGRRRCYVHPDFPERCVKVARTDGSSVLQANGRRFWPMRFRRVYDNNADELKELGALQRNLGAERMGRHFPRVYGVVPTDLGPGLVLDLIRDADGRIARSVREQLANGALPTEFRAAFDEFGRFLMEHRIITRELLDHNLVARRGPAGEVTLHLVDGFGDAAWFFPGGLLPALARRRIAAKLLKGWVRIERTAADLADPERAAKVLRWRLGMLRHR